MNYKEIQITTYIRLIILLLFFGSIQSIYANNLKKQIVKVAYFDMGDYYKEISDGVVSSFDTETLNKIEKYSNLSFTYVSCKSWSEAIEKLNRHEVDLIGTAQWTPKREERYEFCLEGYGYTIGELVALPGNKYIYEDYEAIGKSVIGTTANYVRMEEMTQLFAKHKISPIIKHYNNQNELENALETGEIDLIAANSHTLKNNYEVIEKFTFSPFFFISWKGNTKLTDKIDNAIININIQEPGTDDYLMMKYFSSIIGVPLTKEEKKLIEENKIYDIYLDADTKPISWLDEKTGTMKGGLNEICRQISKNTGLKLRVIPMFVGKTKMDSTSIRTTTVYNGVEENLLAKPGETHAFLNENFNLYYKVDKKIDLNTDTFSIGVVMNRIHLKDYLKNKYPKATFKEYKTPAACLKAVENQDVDFTYLDCRIADDAIQENGIEHVKEFPIMPQKHGIALLFPEENQELLVSIVNKGLSQVNQNELADLFVQYALNTHHPITFKTIVRDYFWLIILILIILILLLVCLASLFTYAKVMEKQKDAIAKANADRIEFFGRMSHDMRTPMNGILGMIELSETSDKVDEIHDNLHKAKSAGQYMLSLINDTLDLQRLESKKLELEKDVVNVADYYNDIFSILKVSAEQKNLDFEVKYVGIDLANYIELDAIRVKQIFSNLISNAIKFTPNGGAIKISVEALGEDGETLHRKYQVSDTGVGMSEDFIRNRLFKPYSQENNQLSTQLTGSGLGMAITKNLVEIMGGRLEIESTLGEGSSFTVYLDIKRAPKEDVIKAAQKKADLSKDIIKELEGKRILLCEDHPLNAEITIKILKKVGCIVEWAKNGQLGVEVFAKSEEHKFDAILMDIRMPVMDGITATKNIRKLNNTDSATIPIIAMTANAYESDIQNCKDAGMNIHLAKPVNPHKLYEVLYRSIIIKA